MQRVVVSSELGASAEVIWAAVKTPHVFVHVAKGMLRYPAAERLDQPWTTRTSIVGWTFLFGVIPFSKHHLTIESIDESNHILVSNERGGLVKTWRHQLITVPIGEGRCRYEDLIDIDAGAFTPIIAAYAKVFYRYRQRRWQRLARILAASAASHDR